MLPIIFPILDHHKTDSYFPLRQSITKWAVNSASAKLVATCFKNLFACQMSRTLRAFSQQRWLFCRLYVFQWPKKPDAHLGVLQKSWWHRRQTGYCHLALAITQADGVCALLAHTSRDQAAWVWCGVWAQVHYRNAELWLVLTWTWLGASCIACNCCGKGFSQQGWAIKVPPAGWHNFLNRNMHEPIQFFIVRLLI